MLSISAESIHQSCSFTELIDALRVGFTQEFITPQRHHHDFPGKLNSEDSTLLLMPSWKAGNSMGVKVVTVSPHNGEYNLPSIHGTYLLFDALTGQIKCTLDGKELTNKRTAATSALASKFLSRKDSKTLMMIGTGDLAPNLIHAHKAVRPIEKILLWGRNETKAQQLKSSLSVEAEIEVVKDYRPHLNRADIISCATLSSVPLIFGSEIQEGQHIDLVGAYKPNRREADTACIKKSEVFVDFLETAATEAGDLAIPISNNEFNIENIRGTITDLSKANTLKRRSKHEITLFKSVGHASEDLIAANHLYDKLYQ